MCDFPLEISQILENNNLNEDFEFHPRWSRKSRSPRTCHNKTTFRFHLALSQPLSPLPSRANRIKFLFNFLSLLLPSLVGANCEKWN